jgi:acetyl esterase/lipase
VAIALAVDVVVLTYLKSPRWADVTAAVVVGGSAGGHLALHRFTDSIVCCH